MLAGGVQWAQRNLVCPGLRGVGAPRLGPGVRGGGGAPRRYLHPGSRSRRRAGTARRDRVRSLQRAAAVEPQLQTAMAQTQFGRERLRRAGGREPEPDDRRQSAARAAIGGKLGRSASAASAARGGVGHGGGAALYYVFARPHLGRIRSTRFPEIREARGAGAGGGTPASRAGKASP